MISLKDFRRLPHAISLLGMSGVGKTTLSKALRTTANWFHYSADYRIGTRYLAEHILDNIKYKIMAMDDQFVANLLRSDSIFIAHNISVDDLEPVSTYLGMYGDPAKGGLVKADFLERQEHYRAAEVESMRDVPHFIGKSWNIYACDYFINDASGSLCEIVDVDDPADPVVSALTDHTLILYIAAGAGAEDALKDRARSHPKPLFYNPKFIQPRLTAEPEDGRGVDPLSFARPLFPELLEFRKPRYAGLAKNFGVTVDAVDLFGPESNATPASEDFVEMTHKALMREIEVNPNGRRTAEKYLSAAEARLAARSRKG